MPDGASVSAGKSHVAICYQVLPRWQQTVPGYSQSKYDSGKEQLPEGNICSPSLMGLIVRLLSPRSVYLHTTCPSLCPTSVKHPPNPKRPKGMISYLTHSLALSTNLISFFDKEDKHRKMDFGIWKNFLELKHANKNKTMPGWNRQQSEGGKN